VTPLKGEKGESVRNRRRTVVGVVTSDRMEKTIVVRVERMTKHPRYEKTIRRKGICYAHDERREARSGDRVELMQTRPLSRLKRWRLVRVVERAAERRDVPPSGPPGASADPLSSVTRS